MLLTFFRSRILMENRLYEHVYIKPANDGLELRVALKSYFEWYNTTRPHSSLDNMTPDEICHLAQETDGLQVA